MRKNILYILSLVALISAIAFGQQKASDQGAATGSIIPPGVMMPYAGATPPSGWVLAYGQEVSQTSATYKKLFAAIGSTYCTTDHGGTCAGGNFRIPDMRGRDARGKDNMGGTAANRVTTAATIDGTTLGKSGGSQTNTLAAANIAQISGTFGSGNQSADHSHGGTTSNDNANHTHGVSLGGGGHEHTYHSQDSGANVNFGSDYVVGGPYTAVTGGGGGHSHSGDTGGISNVHQHGFSTGGVSANHTHSTTVTLGAASPTAVNNLTPTVITNYIIKL